ncbi:MAG: hypothetical protein ACT4OZ_00200 [Gemmatimonadota bacterium]
MSSGRTLRVLQLLPPAAGRTLLIERLRSRKGAVGEVGGRYWVFEEINGEALVEFIESPDYPSLEAAIAAADAAGEVDDIATTLRLRSLEL